MKSLNSKIALAIISLIFFLISMILTFNDMVNYSIISFTVTGILIFLLCVQIFKRETKKEDVYDVKLKKILKTYDSILVYADTSYEINEDSIVYIKNIEELARFCDEINKTIIYIPEEESSCFILKSDSDLLVYVLKKNENSKSIMEDKIEKRKLAIEYLKDENILEDLEKTTVIRFKDNKIYKVSPVRGQKK